MLTAYDPFAGTSAAFRALDQLTGRSGSMTARALSGMPMDAYRVGDNFVAHFDLPGVDPGSIDLSVEGNTLTVSAERSVPQLENAEWAIAERPFGSYLGPDGFQEMRGYPTLVGRTASAGDPELARRLWEESARLTGVDFPAAAPA